MSPSSEEACESGMDSPVLDSDGTTVLVQKVLTCDRSLCPRLDSGAVFMSSGPLPLLGPSHPTRGPDWGPRSWAGTPTQRSLLQYVSSMPSQALYGVQDHQSLNALTTVVFFGIGTFYHYTWLRLRTFLISMKYFIRRSPSLGRCSGELDTEACLTQGERGPSPTPPKVGKILVGCSASVVVQPVFKG